jgi:hypothetical protein
VRDSPTRPMLPRCKAQGGGRQRAGGRAGVSGGAGEAGAASSEARTLPVARWRALRRVTQGSHLVWVMLAVYGAQFGSVVRPPAPAALGCVGTLVRALLKNAAE